MRKLDQENRPSELKCCRCLLTKNTSEYSKNNSPRGYEYRCKTCNRERAIEYHNKNKDKILSKWKRQRLSLTEEQKSEKTRKFRENYWKDIRQILLYRAKERSKKNGWLCDLTITDIIIPKVCPLLKVPFVRGVTNSKWYSYSLDRIDNSKGYIKGNIQVITYLANTMKSKATREELINFSKSILLLLDDK